MKTSQNKINKPNAGVKFKFQDMVVHGWVLKQLKIWELQHIVDSSCSARHAYLRTSSLLFSVELTSEYAGNFLHMLLALPCPP